MGIKRGEHIEELLNEVAEHNVYTYHYIENRKKKDAILSVCATGMGSAKKIRELLVTSLPEDTPIDIIAYDYQSLLERGLDDPIFHHYQVVTIVGTMNPKVGDIPYIAVEEIVLNNNIDVLYQIFRAYLDEEGIRNFSKNILKNFTLSNIVNHLTILNANKVLEDVQDVVVQMEEALEIQLDSTLKVGLYMHLSCLIERLMMRSEVGVFEGLDDFMREHQEFIQVVKSSFRHIEAQYSVEIPPAEIGYIYNYMQIK